MIIESTSELLTVAEFAKAADVTTSYIYKILSTKLQPFVTDLNGKKLISSEALSLFSGESNTVDNDNMEKFVTSLQQSITILQREVDLLTAQLKVKDEQLASADARLHESNSISMSSLNLSERQQQLYLAAINETESNVSEPPKPVKKRFRWPWSK